MTSVISNVVLYFYYYLLILEFILLIFIVAFTLLNVKNSPQLKMYKNKINATFITLVTFIGIMILVAWYYIYDLTILKAPLSITQVLERNQEYANIVFPYMLLQGLILIFYYISYLYINRKINNIIKKEL